MWNRVVNMQQIEFVTLGDVRHARSQRQTVGRVLKQRVTGDFNLVIMDARHVRIEPDRIRIGDEVDVVAAIGDEQPMKQRRHAAKVAQPAV